MLVYYVHVIHFVFDIVPNIFVAWTFSGKIIKMNHIGLQNLRSSIFLDKSCPFACIPIFISPTTDSPDFSLTIPFEEMTTSDYNSMDVSKKDIF